MSSAVFLGERCSSSSLPAPRRPGHGHFSDGGFALGKSAPISLVTNPTGSPAAFQPHEQLETTVKTAPAARPTTRRTAGSSLRRARTNYTTEQLAGLEELFANNQYPGIDEREKLADAVNLPEARVQVWFQNHRARLRRKTKASPDGSSSSAESPDPKPRPAKKAKRSRPVAPSPPEAEPTSPPTGQMPLSSSSSSSPSSTQPQYLPACTKACCASTTHHAPGIQSQAGAPYLNGASYGYYPWSRLNTTAFQYQPSYNPYAYFYPGTTPFLYDYAFQLPPTTAVPTTSTQELEK